MGKIESIEKHEKDYKAGSYKQYTEEELIWWQHLLRKRATHRANIVKKEKDLYDAGNYQLMLEEQYPTARGKTIEHFRK